MEAGAVESLKLDEIEIGPSNFPGRRFVRGIEGKLHEVAEGLCSVLIVSNFDHLS